MQYWRTIPFATAFLSIQAQGLPPPSVDRAELQIESLQSRNQGLREKNEGLRNALRARLDAVLRTRATAEGLIVNMSGLVFRNGEATLSLSAREKLAKIAGILSTHAGLEIDVEGYTDSTGSEACNLRLSEERASNTRDYLVRQGVPTDSIAYAGFGEEDPIASNDTKAGRQQNRRVELVVSGEGITDAGATQALFPPSPP